MTIKLSNHFLNHTNEGNLKLYVYKYIFVSFEIAQDTNSYK